MKMVLKNKINLLVEISTEILGDLDSTGEVFKEFLARNHLGIGIATGVKNKRVIMTPTGEALINEAFIDMCRLLEVDPNLDYEDEEDFRDWEGTTPESSWQK